MTALPKTRLRLRPRPMALWLLAGVAAIAIVWGAGHWAEQRELARLRDATAHKLEVHAQGLASLTARHEYLPFTAAQSADLAQALVTRPSNAVPKTVCRYAVACEYLEAVNQKAGSSVLYLMNTEGTTVASSNWSTGKSFVGSNYRQRPYFSEALEGRLGRFYGIGLTSGEPGFFMASPLRRQGEIVGVVAVKVALDDIETSWTPSVDPIVLFDRRGIAFLSSVPAWKFMTRRVLSEGDLSAVKLDEQYGRRTDFKLLNWPHDTPQSDPYFVTTVIDGSTRSYMAMDRRLEPLGWTLTVTSDQQAVAEAGFEARLGAVLSVALLVLAALYWQLREKRYVEQKQAGQALHQANDELEARVIERTRDLEVADTALREEHAFRKSMEDSLLVGMRARGLDGRMIYVNEALCRMTGYSADELVGTFPPYPYWHPKALKEHERQNADMLAGRAPTTGYESLIRHRDGRDVYTMIYAAPLIDAGGTQTGWMSSVVDITAQKRSEERQRQQEEKLQQTDRLVSLAEMATTLAHELNQPLMAMSNYVSVARQLATQGNKATLEQTMGSISEQVQRAAEIVRRIREFARRHTPRLESCQLNALMGNVLTLISPEARRLGFRISSQLQDDLPTVRGDGVLLEQVMFNLIRNGIDASASQPTANRTIEVATSRTDSTLRVSVADRGTGIAPDVAAKLFESFFSTKETGMGLGLNICRTIIESHHGRLWHESRAGGGTVFSFTLPLAS
jgi:two-component system, LuxR family, sensor histidine kinase DctS